MHILIHMQSEGKLLREYVRDSGKTQEEFALSLDMSRQNLNNYFLMDEIPTDFKRSLEKRGHLLFRKKLATPTGIPYLGELDIFAGHADIANADLSEYITEFISIPGFKDANYFVNVRGSSMYPKYVPGEIIALKLCNDLSEIQYGQAYVVITNENRVLKYVRKSKNGTATLILASANQDYDNFEIERKNVKAMFLVLGKISKDVL